MIRIPLLAIVLAGIASAAVAQTPRPAIATQADDDSAVLALAADPQGGSAPPTPGASRPASTDEGVTAPKAADKARPAARNLKAKPAAAQPTVRVRSGADAAATERLVWARVPLPVVLIVGEERLVTLPRVMRLGMPEMLQAQMRSQVLGRTAYLTAAMPFPPTRVIAEDPSSGEAILLDISALAPGKNTPARGPLEIVVPSPEAPVVAGEGATATVSNLDPVSCSRFALKQVYAPRRLAVPVEGIHAVSVSRRPLPWLYRGARLDAMPIGAWRCGDYYVTSVQLINRASLPVELDPRDLSGRWLTATFRHARLAPKGDERDTTVVMLLSERPFDASL